MSKAGAEILEIQRQTERLNFLVCAMGDFYEVKQPELAQLFRNMEKELVSVIDICHSMQARQQASNLSGLMGDIQSLLHVAPQARGPMLRIAQRLEFVGVLG